MRYTKRRYHGRPYFDARRKRPEHRVALLPDKSPSNSTPIPSAYRFPTPETEVDKLISPRSPLEDCDSITPWQPQDSSSDRYELSSPMRDFEGEDLSGQHYSDNTRTLYH